MSKQTLEPPKVSPDYVKKSIDCTAPVGFTVATCRVGHKEPAGLRCHKCDNCERFRVWKITTDLIRRLSLFCHQNQIGSEKLQLWTFGTNLDDTKVNRILIRKSFNLWRRKWKLYLGKRKSKMLWYCIEAGSKGGRLHIHAIAHTYSNQSKAREIWQDSVSKVIGYNRKPNVGFAPSRNSKNSSVERIARYLAKYLSKSAGGVRKNYYLLGSLIKLKRDVLPALCGSKFAFTKSVCKEYVLYWEVQTYAHTGPDQSIIQHPAGHRLFGGMTQQELSDFN